MSIERTRYLIHLLPEKKIVAEVMAINSILEKNVASDGNSIYSLGLGAHTTIIGFYSDYTVLGRETQQLLDKQMILGLDFLRYVPDENSVGGNYVFNGILVLKINGKNIFSLHDSVISTFKPMIVLKGDILAEDNESCFQERYPYSYSSEKYSPHISLGKNPHNGFKTSILEKILTQKFYFSRLVLSKKVDGMWTELYSRSLD